jgi:transcriptional regulator with XRE-family HTH domain
MKVSEVGAVVRAYRKASGISQKELAALIGISRATLNYLESGRDGEIGASKLLAILDLLGIPFGLPETVDREHDDRVLDRAGKSVKAKLPRKVLAEALATGVAPDGYEGALRAFFDGATEPTVLAVVRAVAAGTGQTSKSVWKNGRALALALGSPRELWNRSDERA